MKERLLLVVLLCMTLLLAESARGGLAQDLKETSGLRNSLQSQGTRILRVHLGTHTLWSDSGFSHEEMAAAAHDAGYDVVFFADNALLFWTVGELVDPSFEDVSLSGQLNRWENGTLGSRRDTAGEVEVIDASSFPQLVRSGNHSVHLAVRSSSENGSSRYGISFLSDEFPEGYLFNHGTVNASHPLLINGITLSTYAFIEKLGIAGRRPPTKGRVADRRLLALNFTDNGWFYLRFTFVTDAHAGRRSNMKLTATLVYSDHPVDNWLRLIRTKMNATDSKVIYLDTPPLGRWLNFRVNVTDLALNLWNQTIIDEWRLGNFEVGTRSRNGELASVYVDDVSINATKSWTPRDYVHTVLQDRLSSDDFKAYSGYSIIVPPQWQPQPSMSVFGASYLDLTRNYNLTDRSVWNSVDQEVSSKGGMLVLGPITGKALADFVTANKAFGVKVVDGSAWAGMKAAGLLMSSGTPLVFAATKDARSPEAYNSSDTWAVMVRAASDSESDILQAIAQGRSYICVSNFTGSFSVNSNGFPMGDSPTYVSSEKNASLAVSFGDAAPGILRAFRGGGIILEEPHEGNVSKILDIPFVGTTMKLFVVVTGQNDSLSIVSNPLTFIHTPMVTGGELFMDNDRWYLESSEWTTSLQNQQLRLIIEGPAGSESTLYLFSPVLRGDAESNRLQVSIRVGNAVIDPRLSFDSKTSTFVLPLRSNGKAIGIVFNFALPFSLYAYSLLSTLSALYLVLLVIILPVLISSLVEVRRRRRRAA